jgi:transposase
MSTMPEAEVFVTLGIDTHKHVHVAVALDQLGRRLDQLEIPTTTAGFAELYTWATELGTMDTVGIEGTGAYGAGLCRWLRTRGVVVVEVDRPDRKLRRNAGKSDPIDAEAAARKVLSGEATVAPKSGAGHVEMIRVLPVARRSAVTSRSQVTNQLHAMTVTAPPVLREQLEGRTTRKRVAIAAKFRPGSEPDTVTAATRYAMKKLALRFRTLDPSSVRGHQALHGGRGVGVADGDKAETLVQPSSVGVLSEHVQAYASERTPTCLLDDRADRGSAVAATARLNSDLNVPDVERVVVGVRRWPDPDLADSVAVSDDPEP